jgi:hypothetical protein
VMKRLFLPLPLLVALWNPFAATASPANCDECSDLPSLYRELLEQEFLLALFQSWAAQGYPLATPKSAQDAAVRQLNQAMAGNLYGVLAPQAPGGASAPGSAAPSFGTVTATNACALVEYVRANPGDTELTPRPTTPTDVRKKLCKPKAEFTLAHEGTHKASCEAAWKANDSKTLETVKWLIDNDAQAYQAGIKVLREAIASLAGKCNWSGSSNEYRADKTKTVPTPDQIRTLAQNTRSRSSALNRATRR